MRNVHIWKAVGEDGRKREVRAERFGGRWKFQAQSKGDEHWTYYEAPSMEDLLELRDVLWRKYQRKRLPWDDVATIDQMIRDRGGEVPEGGE
jgi:hypothetical protein